MHRGGRQRPHVSGAVDELAMSRRRRRRNPQSNTLLYVLGGAAVLGVGYLLLNKGATPVAGATPAGSINISSQAAGTNPLSYLGPAASAGSSLLGGGNSSSNGNSKAPADSGNDPFDDGSDGDSSDGS